MIYYVNVQGGTGLNVSLAQYCVALKEKLPETEIAVMSPYSDIFECCTAVDNVYRPEQARDFLFDAKERNAEIITTRLYDISDFIYKRLNYAQAWDILFGNPLKLKKEVVPSKLTTQLDVSKFNLKPQVDEVLKQIKEKGFDDFVIMQFYGGQSPLVQVPMTKDGKPDWTKVPYNGDNEPLQRHYPREKAAEFIKLFQDAHPKTAVIMFQLPNEPSFEDTFKFVVPYLTYYELAKLPECRGAVTIDSCLHHLIAGLTKTVVIWGHSLPEAFGYTYQTNIIQKCRRDDIIYMSLLGPSAAKISYFNPKELLDIINRELYNENK